MNPTVDLFDWAKHRRDAGMTEAAFAEVFTNPDFGEAAYAAICHVARRQCEVHVDHVLPLIRVKPAHPNAFGAVWMRAIKDGVIVRTGTVRPCKTDPLKRAHQYPVYASGLFYGKASS
ncbi:hypothetical protein ACWX0K_20450 [Nitrobacteraceae bacterium UC4446_H13]